MGFIAWLRSRFRKAPEPIPTRTDLWTNDPGIIELSEHVDDLEVSEVSGTTLRPMYVGYFSTHPEANPMTDGAHEIHKANRDKIRAVRSRKIEQKPAVDKRIYQWPETPAVINKGSVTQDPPGA